MGTRYEGVERMVAGVAGVWLIACGIGCTSRSTVEPGPAQPEGALVRVTMHSQVGVLLDEIPVAMRDRVAQALMGENEDFWLGRARMQIEHTTFRLIFRHLFYQEHKQQLPLPPPEVWNIALGPGMPERTIVDGHDVVVMRYALDSVLLSDSRSPGETEPALAEMGGVWEEPFILPVDPELVLQRTGMACINEYGFPPNSVFEENAPWFFDYECEVEPFDWWRCHQSRPRPERSCVDALTAEVGTVATKVRYERLLWDAELAARYRVGSVTQADAPDLEVVPEGLDNRYLVYRYIDQDSCALVERCVGGTGWRRLLMFDASAVNVGGRDLHIGAVEGGDQGLGNQLMAHNVFEYSACHQHYHFRHYGDFQVRAGASEAGNKQAFCLQTTQRYFNNERTKLTTPYSSCSYQGIATGWGDDYIAGVDCQWVDVTDVEPAPGSEEITAELRFEMNPDEFLCEGQPVLNEQGAQRFEPTRFVTEDGKPVDRPICELFDGWDANNTGMRQISLPAEGSFVMEPCTRGQLGPRRDCGWALLDDTLACTPGQEVELQCQVAPGAAAQAVRLCEASKVLGTGMACTYRHALASGIAGDAPAVLTLECPKARDASEPGGMYALYTAPVVPDDARVQVTCTAVGK